MTIDIGQREFIFRSAEIFMLGFNRWHLLKLFAATLCIVGVSWLALSYFMPTITLTIALDSCYSCYCL